MFGSNSRHPLDPLPTLAPDGRRPLPRWRICKTLVFEICYVPGESGLLPDGSGPISDTKRGSFGKVSLHDFYPRPSMSPHSMLEHMVLRLCF